MARLKINRKTIKNLSALLAVLIIAIVSAEVFGRPGGGSGYSGGGGGGGGFSGGGGGGGSGDGEGIGVLIYLCVKYPHIAIPIIAAIIIFRIIRSRNKPKTTITSAPPPAEKVNRVRLTANILD